MIQNISHLYTTSPVIATTGLQTIKNPTEPETNFVSDAVKLTLSPEAQQFLGTKQADQAQSVNESDPNKVDTSGKDASKTKNDSESPSELSTEETQHLQSLKQTDIEVRNHERQHVAVAGGNVKSGPVYEYTTGPDNKRYAVSGHVTLDMSPVPNDPEATIRKAQVVKKAALAPADPSGADRAVASAAVKMELQASEQLRSEQSDNSKITNPKGQSSKFNAYTQSCPQLGQAINILL